MTLHELHHCSIRTDKLEQTKEFFVTALGMEIGDRPDFPFPGYWLYVEGEPMVHLVGVDPDDPSGLVHYLGDAAMDGPTGPFDHMAFNISEPVPLRKHLKKNRHRNSSLSLAKDTHSKESFWRVSVPFLLRKHEKFDDDNSLRKTIGKF